MPVYLDYASTAPVKQEVLDAMMPYFTERWYNPSSPYQNGKNTKDDVERARKTVADCINAEPNQIIFTSGASEGNSMIPGIKLSTELEHKSNLSVIPCNDLVKKNGIVDIDKLRLKVSRIQKSIPRTVVSVIMTNNETGVTNPISQLAKVSNKSFLLFHTDATQTPVKNIDVKELGVDYLTFSGHKIGAPKGIGFVYAKNPKELVRLIKGSQEYGLRGGTENVPYIIGLAKAMELENQLSYIDLLDKVIGYMAFKKEILKDLDEAKVDYIVNGGVNPSKILSLSFKDIDGKQLAALLDMKGYMVASGSACNSGVNEPSRVLKAMQVPDEYINGTIRVSFGNETVISEIKDFSSALVRSLDELKQ